MAESGGGMGDRVRTMGWVIALGVALVLGYVYASVIVGAGALVTGVLIATLYAQHAREQFGRRPATPADPAQTVSPDRP